MKTIPARLAGENSERRRESFFCDAVPPFPIPTGTFLKISQGNCVNLMNNYRPSVYLSLIARRFPRSMIDRLLGVRCSLKSYRSSTSGRCHGLLDRCVVICEMCSNALCSARQRLRDLGIVRDVTPLFMLHA